MARAVSLSARHPVCVTLVSRSEGLPRPEWTAGHAASADLDMMPMDKSEHEACVDKWMDECAVQDLEIAELLPLFERVLGRLWDRARQTLGDVTLTAIVDRVLYTASERFPLLAALRIEGNTLRWDERARPRNNDEVAESMRFVLVELLTVLGNLTAEILTSALHSDLSRVTRPRDRRSARGAMASPKANDEGKP